MKNPCLGCGALKHCKNRSLCPVYQNYVADENKAAAKVEMVSGQFNSFFYRKNEAVKTELPIQSK